MIRLLVYIDNSLGKLFDRIEPATAVGTEQLSAFRIFFGILMLLYFLPSWSWLNEVPEGFFDPYLLSFAYLTEDFPPPSIFTFLDVTVIILLLLVTLGIYTRKSLLLLYVISGVLFSYSFSFGKIDHYTNLFLFSYPVLAFTNSGTKFALLPDRKLSEKTQKTSLIVLGIIIAFGYFTAGLAKCLEWVDFDLSTNGFLDWIFYCFFHSENQSLLAPYLFSIPQFILEPLDYLAALFEISGFFFLFKGKKYWVFYLTIASIFHLTNLIFFNLSFALNTLCYGIFIVSPILSIIAKKNKPISKKWIRWLVGLSITVAFVKIVQISTDLPVYNYHNYTPLVHIELFVDLVLWLFTISCGIFLLSLGKTNLHRVAKGEMMK
ncbi:hypothetical protein [Pareuzebyella sediminis]|uniref:hypothetical protein n=1 Tax=Pareuzebyella sediminis TaxID=2607998 RepID=UPI0011EFB18C|nr:hypothetical protein [Pareuzebyella sediminis]